MLLYYSGHGILGRGNRLFLATKGSNLDAPRTRSVSAQEIRDFIEDSRAQRQIVVLDCCHSGAFADHAKAAASAPAVTPNTFSSGDAGLYVLTAADTLQFAWDGAELRAGNDAAGGFSQFTSWLVEGLEKGDAAPDDEQITIDALYRYLSRRARAEGSAATPQRFVQGGVGDLVISANPLMGSSQIDPGIMAALHAQEFRTRLGAVAELALLMEEVHTIGARAARRVLQRHLQRERDFQVRRAITKALAEEITSSAEGAPQAEEEKQRAEAERRRAEAARQAEEERQRAEAAGQADEQERPAQVARQVNEQERPAQVARQVEENVQEPRVVPRNEISGSGVKIITHRRSRNRWAVIAAAALMALTIAGGGYSLYKVQQRIEATQKGAGATQRAEAAQKVAAGQEKRLVGTWKRM